MRPPLIGITMSITVGQSPERAFVNGAYLRAVQDAGGAPLPLPPQLDASARRTLLAEIDGLLLTGGADIDPARFGETDRHPTVYDVSAERDTLEIEAVGAAIEREVPLFAICRGIQVLNVALGGSLWQHVPDRFGDRITHSQKEPRDHATHVVTISGETQLAEIVGGHEIRVNSFHHQALRQLGPGLREVAWAEDGVIEGVEMPGAPMPVYGVQWHPEELVGHDEAARNLFRTLVDAARKRAAAR